MKNGRGLCVTPTRISLLEGVKWLCCGRRPPGYFSPSQTMRRTEGKSSSLLLSFSWRRLFLEVKKGVTMTEQSLYERIGGVNAITMVVDRFSDEVVKNPKLNVNPALKEWNQSGKLPGLKFMRTLWICQAAGGPFQYTGKDMHEAHKDLHITSEEFDEVGAEIARALDHFNVPEREKQEVLAAIVARKTEVVNG